MMLLLRLIFARRAAEATARSAGGRWDGRLGFSSAAHPRRRLEGKIALITGGASGLGKATAQEFIREGATVVLADKNSQVGRKSAEELGPQAHFVQCDVTVEQQVAEAVDLAVSRHGRLDVMYNNAGIAGPASAHGISLLDLAHFDQVMNVNVRGRSPE
uniref:Uncharacterized protein n=1 Tax=Ananas comosus var. bracteatus TaxID=296719 RepID=A0A6V7NQ42_ANACO|nr:unnamed protein product [Ananas comosus var. bracteatus]